MTDKRYELTRRKLLAGVGGVGLASAGAGLGTTAYLNDTESFEGNSLTAGALNMVVSVDVLDKSPGLPDPVVDSTDEDADDTADGNEITVTVDDVKPGDWFVLDWHVEIDGNPGYVQVTSVDEDYSNAEGDNPEAETDTSAPGDLGAALLTTIWGSTDTTAGSGRQQLQVLDETTDHNDTWLSGYETPDLDGVTAGGAHYTTLDEAHAEYLDGVVLSDPSGTPIEVGSVSDSADVHSYQLFELPPGVGNDVQGDSVTFTLRFDAEQVRNNDDPFSGA
ncbi:SipW-dependent-type signal peptide-containing protein [Halobacterium sp. CBA1126]|uniref:SipW-dependent-type signal peptide-containing protein n=1 Tax=Halobacterium sp. CBA1126 TaxID=2668074 RepID=UPI0018D26CF5|nr:SipW-dependent-type signal peptide-containing protein [Halobacterium sp. CBA1126]